MTCLCFWCPQKDSHTLYLEQELESLKVVLEIKTNQLHQKEKKLMEMDKLVNVSHTHTHTRVVDAAMVLVTVSHMLLPQVEVNVKLEECLKKLQQENEDYKARMDKHAALSRWVPSGKVHIKD